MSHRLLIVDDKEILIRSFKRFLSREGYEVETACNGLEALKLIEKQKFDLVITDIKMPEMDGMEFLRIAKKKYKDLIILVFTAFGSTDIKEEAMRLGAAEYVEKPAKIAFIKETIEKHLRA